MMMPKLLRITRSADTTSRHRAQATTTPVTRCRMVHAAVQHGAYRPRGANDYRVGNCISLQVGHLPDEVHDALCVPKGVVPASETFPPYHFAARQSLAAARGVEAPHDAPARVP